MSVYFIHAEAMLRDCKLVEKVGLFVVADNAITAHHKFFADDEIIRLKERGLRVVIDKLEKVE